MTLIEVIDELGGINKMKGDFMWAVAQMKDGKKVCIKGHNHSIGYYFTSNGVDITEHNGDGSIFKKCTPYKISMIENTNWEIFKEKIIPLSEKIGNVKIFPHHEILYLEDVKEAVNKYIKLLWDNIDEIANGKQMSFDYDLVKDKAKEIFGDLVEEEIKINSDVLVKKGLCD